MNLEEKSKEELLCELKSLRQRVSELESLETEYRLAMEAISSSRNYLDKIINCVADPIFVKDCTHRWILLNDSYCNLVGYDKKELLYKSDYDFYKKHEANVFWEKDELVFSTGKENINEEEVTDSKGVVHTIFTKKNLYIDELGNKFIVGVISDISDRKKMEKALKESAARYSAIVEDQTEFICRFLPGGIITFMNDACARNFSLKKEDVIGKSYLEMIPAEQHEQVLGSISSLTMENPVGSIEHQVIMANGEIRWNRCTNRALFDEHGNLIEYQAVGRDITSEKRAEEEKEKLQAQLHQTQKMEAMGVLAGGIAHDFNNLLIVIRGYADHLLNLLPTDDSKRDIIERIRKAGEQASSLTRQIMAFSRKQILQPQVLSPRNLLSGLLKMLRRMIGEDLNLITQIESKVGLIKVDPAQIEQVIMNLIVNAIDAMNAGGTIHIQLKNVSLDKKSCIDNPEARPGRFVRLSIADTGLGMEKDIIPHIFEPFYTTKEARSGLGLSVVYGIVKQHNGWINVTSEPGSGSLFEVYLPVYAGAMEDEDENEDISVPVELRGRGKRILLVEDQDDVREFTKMLLEKKGFVVYGASSAEEALSIFEKEEKRIHMVFSDVVLPGKSGLELVEQLVLRKPELKVILSSGYPERKAQWSLISEKGFRFLHKPYDPVTLLKTLGEEMTRRSSTMKKYTTS